MEYFQGSNKQVVTILIGTKILRWKRRPNPKQEDQSHFWSQNLERAQSRLRANLPQVKGLKKSVKKVVSIAVPASKIAMP
ncbi:hypothetical protein CCACVL1_10803 [Corchorus capsularis]|uniref:Uncharacterized protein n=1 Tax=Corchorus capsularis TaxID=210143 RepID=A0A1R3IPI4_COCAP|nr:hypothetical protein CCACVL1_10803 [Corchorus capsularis]